MKPQDIDLCGCACCRRHRRDRDIHTHNLVSEIQRALRAYTHKEALPSD